MCLDTFRCFFVIEWEEGGSTASDALLEALRGEPESAIVYSQGNIIATANAIMTWAIALPSGVHVVLDRIFYATLKGMVGFGVHGS